MATKHSIESAAVRQTPELAERLIQHANHIRNPAVAKAMGDDMRGAARVTRKLWVGIREAVATTADDATRARPAKLVEGA